MKDTGATSMQVDPLHREDKKENFGSIALSFFFRLSFGTDHYYGWLV